MMRFNSILKLMSITGKKVLVPLSHELADETAMTNRLDGLPRTTDVLVMGFGPVGAALCALLGRYGVTTLAVDKVAPVMLAPRAIALDNEALRILQMVGLGEGAFERLAIPEVRMHCPYLGQFGQANTSGTI